MSPQPSQASLQLPRIIPVVVIDDATRAVAVAEALAKGGLPAVEITLRTGGAVDAVRAIAAETDVTVVAGTVLSVEQVDLAVDAGAQGIISPGFSPSVVEHCQRLSLPVIPGIASPSEVQRAYEAGLDLVKFFPAEALGGISTLKAIAAAFPMMSFVPTGGITIEKCESYLRHRNVAAVGGSWLASAALINDGAFDTITQRAAAAVELAHRLDQR